MGERDIDWKRAIHRLRSPLAVVHTSTSMIAEKPDGTTLGNVRRHLKLIEEAVREATTMLDGLDARLDADE